MAEIDINKSGVYFIENLINGKMYIGSAVNFRKRWNLHKLQLSNGNHDNRHLLSAWVKYGVENFKFGILELCDISEIQIKEQFWLDALKPYETGYNICKYVVNGRLGVKSTPEHIAKIIAANKGSKRSPEACINIGKAKKGTKLSEERKQARRDYRHSDEAKAKIASRRGWNHSEETKKKMSESAKTRIQKPFSDKHKENLRSASLKQWNEFKQYSVMKGFENG